MQCLRCKTVTSPDGSFTADVGLGRGGVSMGPRRRPAAVRGRCAVRETGRLGCWAEALSVVQGMFGVGGMPFESAAAPKAARFPLLLNLAPDAFESDTSSSVESSRTCQYTERIRFSLWGYFVCSGAPRHRSTPIKKTADLVGHARVRTLVVHAKPFRGTFGRHLSAGPGSQDSLDKILDKKSRESWMWH